jgi:hypothetical protein
MVVEIILRCAKLVGWLLDCNGHSLINYVRGIYAQVSGISCPT